ncbi:hypothetical protein HU200_001024 [Digitaria exilis]|uniref:Phytocyanin domain-containing protein n=1 Tax=Digitaria exilis TaxID=1010633 RepID=A0A835G219_9POAL|nr:hypothetical protein HU200_001024 [Digitaria exilis]CAB3457361.1 unnamed protein product [Digitaria exilis]
MAGSLSAVLFAAFYAVLLPAASQSSSSPAVYGVGDEMGWTVPPPGATDALTHWAARHRFLVGDVLVFKYGGSNDSVLLVRHGDYDRCSASTPLSLFAGGSSLLFKLTRPGIFHFIGGEPARCEAGQRMAVRVVDDGAGRSSLAGGAPTPAAPGTQQPFDDTEVSGHRHRGLSLALKLFKVAAMWFGAVFLLICFIVWVVGFVVLYVLPA